MALSRVIVTFNNSSALASRLMRGAQFKSTDKTCTHNFFLTLTPFA
jgi:hypothetical protein